MINISIVYMFFTKLNYFIHLFTTLDHKIIGLSYLLFGIFCGMLGFFFSFFIRIELLLPGSFLFSGSSISYNFSVSTHGIMMIFYASMPIFINGFGNYFVPFMVGSRDMSLPRLNNFALLLLFFSFFIFLLSSGYFSFYFTGVASGWTLYPPLSIFINSYSIDFLIFSLHLSGISSLLNAINTILTIQYSSSLTIWHLNPFVWSILITSYLLILVLPVLVVGITTLLFDHLLGTSFYSVSSGGDPILYQHLFWFFGHPEVYILILPAFGLISEIISEHINLRILGYKSMIWSMLTIAILGSLVWGHHMYTVGLELDTQCYFTLASTLISVPTGLKVYLWISSYLDNKFEFSIPILFSLLFIATFIFGGLTGIILAQAGIDLLFHDTYFVVAHFHYVLAISLVYVFFSTIYNYFFYFTGYNYNLTFARIHLYTFSIGTNFLFMPMHFLGASGMPRRVFDYSISFSFWNQFSTFGLLLSFISLFWFFLATFPFFTYFIYNFFNLCLIKLNKVFLYTYK